MPKKKQSHNYKVRRCKTKSNLKQKKSKRRKGVQTSHASHHTVEKGLNEICATLSQLEVQKESEGATNVFLRNNGFCGNSIGDPAKQRKKERRRKCKKSRNKNFSTLQLLAALPEIQEPNDDSKSIVHQVPVKIVNTEFLYSQKDSKKLYKKILRRERSKQRQQKYKVL